jgi:hypothetical protein
MHSTTEKHLQTLINPFTLAVRLWVIGSSELQLCAEMLKQQFPEGTCEDAITVGDNCVWHTMKLDH